MSRKARKATRKQQPRPAPGGADPRERQDLSGNDRKTGISSLTPRQQAVLPVLAISPSIAQAARDTGVSERTLYRWLDDTEFQEQLSRFHQAAYELARKQLQALMPHALSIIAREATENPAPSIRIRAARYTMDYAVKFCGLDQLADDLSDLRTLIRGSK